MEKNSITPQSLVQLVPHTVTQEGAKSQKIFTKKMYLHTVNAIMTC